MSSTYGAHKLAALKQKFGSVRGEFACWRLQSKRGGPFEKHNSQVRRIQSRLRPLYRQIRSDLQRATADDALARGQSIEQSILAAHRIWEFFRVKLAQREGRLARFLKAADEFAWACYKPARLRAFPDPGNAGRKEPPLVFFNGRLSPFAVPRDRKFRAEEVPRERLHGAVLEAILKELPVPVVGVPWTEMGYAADALAIGHEVGHLVAGDFGLCTALVAAVDRTAIPEPRRAAWKAWLNEVFADVYGCLATGPAFVAALIDYFAADPSAIQEEMILGPPWGDYPSVALRVRLNLRVLFAIGFKPEAVKLAKAWLNNYRSHSMTEFNADLKPLANSLLSGPYPELGGCALTDVLCFTAAQQELVGPTVRQVRQRGRIHSNDVRVLFAAFRGLFEADPGALPRHARRLFVHIQEQSQEGVRSGDVAWSLNPNHPTTRALKAGDIERGQQMLETLNAALAAPDPARS